MGWGGGGVAWGGGGGGPLGLVGGSVVGALQPLRGVLVSGLNFLALALASLLDPSNAAQVVVQQVACTPKRN